MNRAHVFLAATSLSLCLPIAAFAADDDVKCVQLALQNLGLDPGPADNAFGQKTKAAADKAATYVDQVKGLPPLSYESANQWCDALRPPMTLSDGYWIAEIAGACGVLKVDGDQYAYKAGPCAGSGLASVEYEASVVSATNREIRVDSAVCDMAYMVTDKRVRCNWQLGNYREDGIVFDRHTEAVAGF